MLKHLKAQKDWDEKSLSAKGFTLIELLVVIVILGILAGVVIFAIGSIQERAQKNACKTEYNTIETAIAAWTASNASDPDDFPTTYPMDNGDLVQPGDQFLQREPELYSIASDGTTPPVISSQNDDKCDDNPFA